MSGLAVCFDEFCHVFPHGAMFCHVLPVLQETAGGGFRVLLTEPQVRRPLSMAIILMALQQYCGINGNLVILKIVKCQDCQWIGHGFSLLLLF